MSRPKQSKNELIIVISVCLVAITLVSVFMLPHVRKWNTEETLDREVLLFKQQDLEYNTDDKLDAWGSKIVFVRSVAPEAVTYTGRSAGRDKVFLTDDDIVKTEVDLNKSRIIAKWLGQRAKQAIEGAKEGFAETSKFAEVEK